MSLLYPYVDWTQTFAGLTCPATTTNPAITVDSDNNVYFAFATSSAVGSLGATTGLQIVVGSYSATGAQRWLLRDSAFLSSADTSAPSLVLGPAGELYMAYHTTGAATGKVNLFDTFSFCGTCGASAGRYDIVVVRINGAVAGTPAVNWVLQDASIDSCSNETNPKLLFDTTLNRLLIAYTSSGAIVCGAPVSSTQNVIVVALDPVAGGLLWTFQSDLLNCTSNNQSPAIAVDAAGNIYLANVVSSAVFGGGEFTGTTFVEVIRIHAEGSPLNIVRDWILSAVSTINPPTGTNSSPTLQVDSARNRLLISYVTTGTIADGDKRSGTLQNLVFAAVNSATGSLLWTKQSAIFNPSTFGYTLCDGLTSALDVNGNLFVACRVNAGTDNSILLFRVNGNTGAPVWYYATTLSQIYRGFLPAHNSATSPNTVVRSAGYRSAPAIGIYNNLLYISFFNRVNSSSTTGDFYLMGTNQLQRFRDLTAFEYMDQETGICGEL